jgi:hypothetical protein
MQMRQYHARAPTRAPAVSHSLLQPAGPTPIAKGRPPPTRFKVKGSVFEKTRTHQASTVEAEYQKYTSGITAKHWNDTTEDDILRFWEVSIL